MKNNVSRISYLGETTAYLVSRVSYLAKKEKRNASDVFSSRDARCEIRDTNDEIRDTLFSSPFTRYEIRDTRYNRRNSPGFTLLEVIGVLAVMATLMAIIAPKVLDQIDRAMQDAEEQNLAAIGEGVELYLRKNFSWPPNLSDLSPDYVPFGNTLITTNDRGYPRYFVVHPDTDSYDNATGLTTSTLADARFLLISDVSTDASPTINNVTQFNNWWNTDTTTTPDLIIYRGQVGEHFHLLSISAVGAGGSYRISGTTTNSGGSTLTTHGNYHLAGRCAVFINFRCEY